MSDKIKSFSPKSFFFDVLRGYVIGMAFIIPGFSGGSIAAVLGIYEKLVGAIADIFKSFLKSLLILLPIGIGMGLGAISLMFPLKWALASFPIPTVSLFVGLTIGALPSITDKLKGKFKPSYLVSFILPTLAAFLLCFIPVAQDRNLGSVGIAELIPLFFVGILGSAALVIPGISGSMLLLIIGYYNPILALITGLLAGQNILNATLVIATVGSGIAVGFFAISVVMKLLFKRHPRGTYFAILGFIVGSIPSVFISTAKEAGYGMPIKPGTDAPLFRLPDLMPNAMYWIVSIVLLAVGFFVAFSFVKVAKKFAQKNSALND
ncbi:MAG: DUF368 domain-containing protein [Clostridia bacterium]|nr:DUF368 domain-containing protein [Clostridia bacterium]